MVDVQLPNIISENSTAIAAGVGGLALGAGLGAVAGYRAGSKKSKRKKSKSKSRNSRKRSSGNKSRRKKGSRKLKFGSAAYRKRYLGKGSKRRKQKQPHTAGKRKDTSQKRIRYTSKNQPYVIMPNGKARFISKKSARSSKKRKGGRY